MVRSLFNRLGADGFHSTRDETTPFVPTGTFLKVVMSCDVQLPIAEPISEALVSPLLCESAPSIVMQTNEALRSLA